MSAGGRADDLEYLFMHIDIISSKLDILRSMTNAESVIGKHMDSLNGKNWVKHVENFMISRKQSKTPIPATKFTAPVQHLQWIKTIESDLIQPFTVLKYVYQFCIITQGQLRLMESNMKDYDIRWNNYFTVRNCRLFVEYCRIIFYFSLHPNLKNIVLGLCHTTNPNYVSQKLFFNKIAQFLLEIEDSPFAYIKDKLSFLTGKMTRFTSSIGSFIARLFGTFPLVTWEQFSIFQKTDQNVETTLMNDEHIILSNLKLFKETIFFFMFTLYEKSVINPCFELIIEALLTESPHITITRTFHVGIRNFLKMYPGRLIQSKDAETICAIIQQKFHTSHVQRMMHATFLLQDILNISQFDSSILPSLMNSVSAISGLAYYELDTYFQFGARSSEAMDLLDVLLDVAQLINENQESIRRFYVFNLASVDLQFLQHQLNPALFKTSNDRISIPTLITDLANNLATIDLVEFDKGTRYDFTPFLVTYGRYLKSFNEFKVRERGSYLEPVFEHLSTIRLHILMAQSPMNSFLTYCPLHTMWTHASSFKDHIDDRKVKINHLPSLLKIFTYFSQDVYCLRQLLNEVDKLTKLFPLLRNAINTRLTEELCQRINPNSPLVRIGLQTHEFKKPEEKKEVPVDNKKKPTTTPDINKVDEDDEIKVKEFNVKQFAHNSLTPKLARSQIKSISQVVNLKKFCNNIPKSVLLFDKIDKTAKFFTDDITMKLAKYLFPGEVPTPSNMDISFSAATQFLWPMFALLGASFTRKLFECRFVESMGVNNAQSFLDYALLLDGTENVTVEHSQIDVKELREAKTKLITKIDALFAHFAKSGWTKTLYINGLNGFYSLSKGSLKYDPSEFFSKRGFHYLIRNLGPHCGAYLDRHFIHNASNAIKNVFNQFCVMLADTNRVNSLKFWFEDFSKRSALPFDGIRNNNKFEKVCQELLSLGVNLQCRKLLREAMSDNTNEMLPGFQSIIINAIQRSLSPSSSESLISEVFTDNENEVTFITECLLKAQGLKKQAFIELFFFYIALFFVDKSWDNSKYIILLDTITNNMHLVNLAVAGLIRQTTALFESSSSQQINDSFKIFLSVASSIVAYRKQILKNDDSARAITVLVDKLPSAINIEYERVEEVFPSRFINFAYQSTK